jgi:DtxR family Mn-dependent transcriptional regulator
MTLSESAQDYLKAIYKEAHDVGGEANGQPVTTQALAERLDVAPASATAMVKRLASLHLVEHEPYRGVVLSPAGKKIALEVIRHHRLVETFLAQVLGMDWDLVHDEAEKWEHVLSKEVEAHMDAALRSPTHDPHGAPIPTRDGVMPPELKDARLCLLDAASGEIEVSCVVRRVSDREASVLKFLREIGVVPGAQLKILPLRPEEGVLRLQVHGREGVQVLGAHPAALVWVSLESECVATPEPQAATPDSQL